MKIRLREIKVIDLNSRTVILLNQFVRLARLRFGLDIKMQYPDVIRRVVNCGTTTDNPELLQAFHEFRRELVKNVKAANLENPSFNIYTDAA